MVWKRKLVLIAWILCLVSCLPPEYEIEIEVKTYDEITTPKDQAVMVLIPAGYFMMGKPQSAVPEGPAHKVYLEDFYIDKFEVTNQQFELFNPNHKRSRFSDCDHCPVSNLSWHQANEYAVWAGKRLPTEAEWEKAAGGGARKWPWGNRFSYLQANIIGRKDGFLMAAPVGSFPLGSSLYGVMDMAGNIWEWCADWYGRGYYKQSADKNPQGPDTGVYKVLRGGSAATGKKTACTTYRAKFDPETITDDKGVRLAMDIPDKKKPINIPNFKQATDE